MARCTAPVRGHIRGGGADCPVHGRWYGGNGYGGGYGGRSSYGGSSYSSRSHSTPAPRRYPSYSGRSSAGGGGRSSSSRARRSAVTYSSAERATFDPVREQVVRIAQKHPDRRDLFLCHAWDDRKGPALDLYNHLIDLDVKVWFSEKDVPLGTPLLRQIDKGLANSRAAVVLVTPALLESLSRQASPTRSCPSCSLPTESSRSRTAQRSRRCGRSARC